MQKLMLALVAIAAVTLSAQAQAQTPKFSADSEEVYWLVGFHVPQSEMDKFTATVRKMVARTTREPGTLEYQYSVGPDGTTVDIFERYTNSAAAIAHVTGMGATPMWKDFMGAATPIRGRFMVYGAASPELRTVLEGFYPVYFSTIDGFTK
jgi:quinol monooxygenase YgiN